MGTACIGGSASGEHPNAHARGHDINSGAKRSYQAALIMRDVLCLAKEANAAQVLHAAMRNVGIHLELGARLL